jgi:hypothetical protein
MHAEPRMQGGVPLVGGNERLGGDAISDDFQAIAGQRHSVRASVEQSCGEWLNSPMLVGVRLERLRCRLELFHRVCNALEAVVRLRNASCIVPGQGGPLRAADQLVRSVAAVLRPGSIEIDRLSEGVAEADVDEVRPVDLYFKCEVVDHARRPAEQHCGAEPEYTKSERFKKERERAVQFETPAAPALLDDLGDVDQRINRDAVAVDDVEILERNSRHVELLQFGQGGPIVAHGAAEANPFEVAGDVYGGDVGRIGKHTCSVESGGC